MTELTELEIAKRTWTVLFWACHTGELVGQSGLELRGICEHWEARVKELELEAGEPKDPVDGLPPALVERVARLEKAMRLHRHYPSPSNEASMLSSTAVNYELYPALPAGF